MILDCDLTCDQAVTSEPDVIPTKRDIRRLSGGRLIVMVTKAARRNGRIASTVEWVEASPGEQAVAYVTERLEQAGRTVLALPRAGYTTTMKGGALDYVRQAVESYGWDAEPIRPSYPSNKAISMMDESYGWLALIPDSRLLSRRIVGARSLMHPVNERHLFSWRRLGSALNIHYEHVQRHHAAGIADIVAGLHQTNFFK